MALRRQLPDARLFVAPDSTHVVLIRQPALFNAAAMGFWRSIGGDRRQGPAPRIVVGTGRSCDLRVILVRFTAGATLAAMARDSRRPLHEAWIVSAVRTPIGRYAGALGSVRPDDLAALVISAAVERVGLEPGEVDDVVLGNANGAGEENRNVARMAALLAGFPVSVPGQTVNRLCGSGLQAINIAAHAIMVGDGEVFVAGGVESMTRAPLVMLKPEACIRTG